MTLNKSHRSISVCFHPACLCLTGLGLCFHVLDSLVWAFPRALDVYVPFGTLTSSVSLKILEITARKQQQDPEKAGRISHSTRCSHFKNSKEDSTKNPQEMLIALCLYGRIWSFPSRLTHLPTSVLARAGVSQSWVTTLSTGCISGCLLLCLLLVSGSFSRTIFASNQGFCH